MGVAARRRRAVRRFFDEDFRDEDRLLEALRRLARLAGDFAFVEGAEASSSSKGARGTDAFRRRLEEEARARLLRRRRRLLDVDLLAERAADGAFGVADRRRATLRRLLLERDLDFRRLGCFSLRALGEAETSRCLKAFLSA